MNKCVVSVIVPIYNCEQYIQKCVESLQYQTHRELEIILVDDGSQDSSLAICYDMAIKDGRIKVVHKNNGGAAAARKIGIARATGNYVTFVDADDWIMQDYIEQLLHIAQCENVDAVIGTYQVFSNEKLTSIKLATEVGKYDCEKCVTRIYPYMLSTYPFYTFGIKPSMCGKLFKTEIVKKNIDTLDTGIIFGEDGCFTYSALLDCSSIYISNECGYIYRQNPTSVTHRFDERLLQDGKKLKAFLEKLAATKEWDVNTQIDEYMAYVCNYTVTQALKSGYGTSKENRKRLKRYIRDVFPVGFLKNRNFLKSKKTTLIRYMLIRCRALTLLSKILLR